MNEPSSSCCRRSARRVHQLERKSQGGAGGGLRRPEYQALSPVHLSSGLAVVVQPGWPHKMYRDSLTEVASEAVGILVLLALVVVGGSCTSCRLYGSACLSSGLTLRPCRG